MRGFIPPQNTQETVFVKRASELFIRALNLGVVQYSSFLDLRQQELFKAQSNRYKEVTVHFEYGYDGEGERCVAAVRPQNCYNDTTSCPIVVLYSKIVDDSLTHRDFLGAIMSLRIIRDFIGDIIITDKTAYIIVHSNMAKIITDELCEVKNSSVKFEYLKKRLSYKREIDDLKAFTVASMRIDTVVSSLLNISRNDATKLVRQGMVSINHLEVTDIDFAMFDNDTISIKQRGKYKIFCDGKKSRKDRVFINFTKY